MATKFFNILLLNWELGFMSPPLECSMLVTTWQKWYQENSKARWQGHEASSWFLKTLSLEPWAAMWEVWLARGCHAVRKPKQQERPHVGVVVSCSRWTEGLGLPSTGARSLQISPVPSSGHPQPVCILSWYFSHSGMEASYLLYPVWTPDSQTHEHNKILVLCP